MKIFKEFSRDGFLLIEGQFDVKGLKVGIWKEYYKNGNTATEEEYHNGKLHGNYISYHENGNIWCIGNFCHGDKNGKFKIYDTNGNLFLIQEYSNDKLINQESVEDSKNGVFSDI